MERETAAVDVGWMNARTWRRPCLEGRRDGDDWVIDNLERSESGGKACKGRTRGRWGHGQSQGCGCAPESSLEISE